MSARSISEIDVLATGFVHLDPQDAAAHVSKLRRALQELKAGAEVSDATRKFLLTGIAVFLTSDGDVTLDNSFGFGTRGGLSTKKAFEIDRRDAILKHLARTCWPELPHGLAAKQIRKALERYEAGRFSADRELGPPATEPHRSFYKLLVSDARIPQADRLRQILAREIQTPL